MPLNEVLCLCWVTSPLKAKVNSVNTSHLPKAIFWSAHLCNFFCTDVFLCECPPQYYVTEIYLDDNQTFTGAVACGEHATNRSAPAGEPHCVVNDTSLQTQQTCSEGEQFVSGKLLTLVLLSICWATFMTVYVETESGSLANGQSDGAILWEVEGGGRKG